MRLFSFLFPHPRVSLEQQLEDLAECGIRLKPQYTIDTLLQGFARERYEERPYIGAIIRMGSESETGEPLSDSLFHLDTECIEEPGDYARIAERMRDLAEHQHRGVARARLKKQNTGRRYTYCDLKGQNCLVGCATEDQLRKLRKMTGMNFTWLE